MHPRRVSGRQREARPEPLLLRANQLWRRIPLVSAKHTRTQLVMIPSRSEAELWFINQLWLGVCTWANPHHCPINRHPCSHFGRFARAESSFWHFPSTGLVTRSEKLLLSSLFTSPIPSSACGLSAWSSRSSQWPMFNCCVFLLVKQMFLHSSGLEALPVYTSITPKDERWYYVEQRASATGYRAR